MPNAEITDNGGIMNGNDKGIAAIWCRVSTHDQRELSLDSQEIAVRRILEAESYRVPPQYVLKVDWTSLDLMACPQFQLLRQWITDGQVQAVGTLDRDRLQAQGLQRLLFLSDCKRAWSPAFDRPRSSYAGRRRGAARRDGPRTG